MTLRGRFWLLAGVSVASLFVVQGASAQPTDSPTAGQGPAEEVIVTARRREEKIQDVPISITALTGDQIAARGISDVRELSAQVPALTITTQSISRDSVAYAIRGQVNNETQLLSDPSVGTYFAEVVLPRPAGFNYQLFDIQNIQILKGVQGTLFGRNMTGGAVLIEPAHPTYEWGGSLKARGGNYNMYGGEGVLNIPVVKDKVAVRLAARVQRRDGFTESQLTGRKYDNVAAEAYRGSVLLNPTDHIESLFVYDYLHSRNDGTAAVLVDLRVPSTAGNIGPTADGFLSSRAYFAQQVALNRTCNFRCIVGSELELGNRAPNNGNEAPFPGQQAFDAVRAWGVTNKTKIEIGDVTVTNIAAFRFLDFNRLQDYDGIPRVMITSAQFTHTRDWSEELRANGKAFDGRLDWTTGAYYFREAGPDGSVSSQYTALASAAGPIESRANKQWADTVATSYAVYGAGEFAMTDRWKVAGGLRWNHDQRETLQHFRGVRGAGACLFTIPGSATLLQTIVPSLGNDCTLDNGNAYRAVTWDVTLKWQPDPNTMLYAAQRKGYRAGGFSLRVSNPALGLPFAPETVKETEFGAKKTWDLGGGARLVTNGALFYQNYTNVQTQTPFFINNITVTIVGNTASQKNVGGELEANLSLPWGLDVGGFYSRVSIGDRVGSNDSIAYRRIPKHKAGANAAYTFPFDEAIGKVVLSGNISYQSHTSLDDFDRISDMDGYAVSNFHLDWNDIMDSGFGAGLFCTNCLDKTYFVGTVALIDNDATHVPGAGQAAVIVGEPRMFGGELRYKF